MLAREAIIEYLKTTKSASSTQIHNHLQKIGFKRCSSMGVLSKMVTRGIVVRTGHHQHQVCQLNPNHSYNSSNINPKLVFANTREGRPDSENTIFDECRQLSPIYQVDQLLKSAREHHATHLVRP